jgi:hypothetical protein
MDRRSFIRGAGAGIILGAPAVVSASSLMKIWVPKTSNLDDWEVCCDYPKFYMNTQRGIYVDFEEELNRKLLAAFGGKPNTQDTRNRVVEFIRGV